MPDDRHLARRMTVRPPEHTRAEAQRVLDERGWTMNDFVGACLALLAANPDAMLRRLTQFRPATKRGRPPKTG